MSSPNQPDFDTADRGYRAIRNDYIIRSFRDTADRDYIAARALFKLELREQFYWAGLQAIEKYLKAILLFSDQDTRNISHNIVKALDQVHKLDKLNFQITDDARQTVAIFSDHGEDRYFDAPQRINGDELFKLDDAVWQIRRFCDDYFFPHVDGRYLAHERKRLAWVCSEEACQLKAKFRPFEQGHLEHILKNPKKSSEPHAALVWRNAYFAQRNRQRIRHERRGNGSQPANFMCPELIIWMRSRVILSAKIKKEMERLLRENGPTYKRATSKAPRSPSQ